MTKKQKTTKKKTPRKPRWQKMTSSNDKQNDKKWQINVLSTPSVWLRVSSKLNGLLCQENTHTPLQRLCCCTGRQGPEKLDTHQTFHVKRSVCSFCSKHAFHSNCFLRFRLAKQKMESIPVQQVCYQRGLCSPGQLKPCQKLVTAGGRNVNPWNTKWKDLGRHVVQSWNRRGSWKRRIIFYQTSVAPSRWNLKKTPWPQWADFAWPSGT